MTGYIAGRAAPHGPVWEEIPEGLTDADDLNA
jgi:hypothetical protein